MYKLGIDLGGTNIVAGVVDGNYNIVATGKVKTNLPRPAEEIVILEIVTINGNVPFVGFFDF